MPEKKKKKTDTEQPPCDDESATAPDATDADEDEVSIAPHEKPVGEGAGNLKRREEWFRKRTGSSS